MTARHAFEQPWAGHDRLARQLSRGMYQGARELMGMALGIALVLTLLAVLLVPGPATYGVLVIVLAVPTSLRVGRGTEQAIEAVRSLWLAPGTARGEWLQGWAHLALLQGPAWAAAGLAAVAWHEGLSGAALYVFGAVLAAQALCAWGAYSLRQRAPHEWKFLALFSSVMLGGGTWVPMGWVGLALLIGGAGLLGWLWRQLRQLRPGQGTRPKAAGRNPRALSKWLNRWVVMGAGQDRRSVGQVLTATLNPILMMGINPAWREQSQWLHPHGPVKLLLLGWLTLTVLGSLVHKPIGWREWLRPGGVPRHRLGTHILLSTLKLQGVALSLAVAVVGTLTWWLADVTPAAILNACAQSWPLLLEWSVATALAVLWAGLQSRLANWIGSILLVIATVWLGVIWGRTGALPVIGTVDASYVGLLLVALAALVWLANVVWARADLHRLMQGHKPRTLRWWET